MGRVRPASKAKHRRTGSTMPRASHALETGAPVALVRDTLGQSSVSTTNGYLHARPNDSSARYLAV
jgi:hypothetical protein